MAGRRPAPAGSGLAADAAAEPGRLIQRVTPVADLIAAKRALGVPCGVCELENCAELLEHRRRGDDEFERLRCSLDDVTFRRIWIAG